MSASEKTIKELKTTYCNKLEYDKQVAETMRYVNNSWKWLIRVVCFGIGVLIGLTYTHVYKLLKL